MMARLLIFSAILLFIDLLAFQAFRMLVGSSGKTIKIITYSIYWAIPVITVLFLIGVTTGWSDQLPKTIRVTLRAMIFIFYFAKLLIAVMILVDDLRRGLFALLNLSNKEWHLSTDRSKWMAYAAIILGSIPVVSLLYGMARNPYRYQVLKSSLKIKGLDPSLSGLKIVQISDIHSGSFLLKEPVERSIRLINDLQPDLVVFTGDLVNSMASEMEPFVEMFSQIKAPLGVYSILGNHDYGDYHHWLNPEDKHKNFEDLKQIHRNMGWDLLLNEHSQIPYGTSRVNVVGVENYSANLRFPKYGDLRKATDG
ncbi:MAG: metallophosphoesterase, partial [Saprospiraceae bacterium]